MRAAKARVGGPVHRGGIKLIAQIMINSDRTPINRTQELSVLVAAGGLRKRQFIGESNSRGEEPTDAPYRPENVLAMVYRHLLPPHPPKATLLLAHAGTDPLLQDWEGAPLPEVLPLSLSSLSSRPLSDSIFGK